MKQFNQVYASFLFHLLNKISLKSFKNPKSSLKNVFTKIFPTPKKEEILWKYNLHLEKALIKTSLTWYFPSDLFANRRGSLHLIQLSKPKTFIHNS